jgi:hypothetical protein
MDKLPITSKTDLLIPANYKNLQPRPPQKLSNLQERRLMKYWASKKKLLSEPTFKNWEPPLQKW